MNNIIIPMHPNSKNIFSPKNLTYIITGIALAVLLLSLTGFSVAAIVVVCALAAGFYLFFARAQSELLSYSFICLSFFILYYLVSIAAWPVWTVLILAAICIYLIFTNFASINIDKRLSPIYSAILILIIAEVFLATYQINLAIIIKSLAVTVCYYLFSGLIFLNINKNLHLKPILTYSIIFTVIIILLFNIQ